MILLTRVLLSADFERYVYRRKMKLDNLDLMCCPNCKGSLSVQIRKQNHQEIQTGILFCASCSEKYPIVSDRPVLMVNNAVHNWLSPIDEALNPSENRRPEGPLSILRLKRLGVETAVGIAASQDKKCIDDSFDISSDLKKLKGKIKYIKSGNWLNARGRKTGFLSALTNPSESVSSFLKLLTSLNGWEQRLQQLHDWNLH